MTQMNTLITIKE